MEHQMLVCAYAACRKLELVDSDGRYSPDAAYLKAFYKILRAYGLRVSDREQKAVLDGTHELYVKPEPAEKPGKPEAAGTGAEETGKTGEAA